MNFLKRFSFRYWGRWVGFRWINYDYSGSGKTTWGGFDLHLGFATIRYRLSRCACEKRLSTTEAS
jgi:hypothetical protein